MKSESWHIHLYEIGEDCDLEWLYPTPPAGREGGAWWPRGGHISHCAQDTLPLFHNSILHMRSHPREEVDSPSQDDSHLLHSTAPWNPPLCTPYSYLYHSTHPNVLINSCSRLLDTWTTFSSPHYGQRWPRAGQQDMSINDACYLQVWDIYNPGPAE